MLLYMSVQVNTLLRGFEHGTVVQSVQSELRDDTFYALHVPISL